MLKVTRSRLQQYSVAGLSVGLALLLMLALDAWLAMTKTPFLLFFGAVVVSAWYGGLRAGLLSTFLSVLISDYFFVLPIYSLALDLPNTMRLGLFAFEGVLFSVLCEALRNAKRRAEVSLESLQTADVRYRRIVETAGEGIWLFDAQLYTEYVNLQLAQMLGYNVEEMLQRPILDFMDQAVNVEAHRYIAQLKQGMQQRFDFRFQCRDGSNLWAMVSTTPILGESGEFQGGLAMISNLTERKQIEESLQVREEQLRLFVEHAPAAIAMLDNQMRYILVSQRWLTDFQLQNQNIIGRSHYEVFPEIPDSWREIHALCLAGAVRKCEKELFPRADGSIDWVKWEIHPWRNRADEIGGIIIFTEVITERVQAQEAVQAANNRITMILESITEAFVAFDREWRYTYVNQEAGRLLQKPPEELLGKQLWKDVFPQLIGDTFYQEAHRAIAQQVPVEFEEFCEVLHRWLEIRACPNSEGLAVYFRDVTERKREQEALQQSEARFRRLFESNLIGVAFWNVEGFITDTNDAYLRIVGYSRQEFDALGRIDWRSLTPPEYKHLDDRAIEETLATGVSSIYEKEYVRRDGTRVPIVLGVALMDDSQINGVAFVLDISKGKQAEQERDRLLQAEQKARTTAEAANRLKDEFLAVLSHELRSPLNAMLGWLTIMRTENLDEETTARALETIERNARAQAQLVEDLLDVSRIIQGKLRLNARTVDLLPAIEAAIDTVNPAALAKNIQLQPVLDPDAGPVFGDSDRLQQIVWNLLSNAIKFTPKGGRVQIRLSRVHSHVEIVVSDTGKGISPEFLPYVFERFRQADSSTTRSFGGLGLGLSIARHLVELHGGSVDVESPGEGQGATFTVKLPLSPVSSKIQQPRVHPTVGGSLPFDCTPQLDGLRILVVDDEVDARELLIQILVECGAEVVAVDSADEVIAALKEQTSDSRFDILISDIGMPRQDGYALLRRVRALKSNEGGRIPAIALTAYARAEDRKAAFLAGFQSHVAKPVEPGELIAVIGNLTGRSMS
ncbi:PAS domain S-box protein [Scytonema tolypothrichoides VB-61278]|nr:PAS domain S-box protein [Scytonema tolypothrichoides VB-61278]